VIALSLLTAAALTAAPFTWPRPDVIEEVDVPGNVVSGGVPVRFHVLRSKQNVQQLLAVFAAAFEGAGFWVPQVQRRLVAEPHVTGLDWHGFVSYSAILHPNDDGTTTCVLGEATLARKADPAPDFAPAFPGASGVLRTDQEGARILSYSAHANVDEVKAFYKTTLARSGFQASPDETGVYVRAKQRLLVAPSADPSGGSRVVLVLTEPARSR
jgi:hypothetical protein